MLRNSVAVAILLFLGTLVASAADPVKVIVFPLSRSKTTSLSWLGEGIAISLSEQIKGHRVKVMTYTQLLEFIERMNLPLGAQLSRGSMIRIAQTAAADLAVMGTFSGSAKNLKITVRILDIKTLKLSGGISANGPLSVLPQMENELAWLILANSGLEKAHTRKEFQAKSRDVPNNAFAYYVQSFGTSNENEQLRLLTKALELHNNFPEARFRIGSIYFQKGDCGAAMPHLIAGSSRAGTYAESQFMLGTCYLKEDQSDKAIQILSRILQISRSYEALNNLGVAYLRQGDLALAINALVEANTLAPSNSTVSLNLAVARHLQRNETGALTLLREAIKNDAKNGMLQFLMGFLLKKHGENESAAVALGIAESLGINEEKLQQQHPKTWTRIISNWEDSEIF